MVARKKKSENFLDTNTKVMSALKILVEQNPKQCILHATTLDELKNEVQEISSDVKDINKKLFITNGGICMAEDVRNVKGKVNRHINEHLQHTKNAKWNIGTVISMVSVTIALIAVLVVAYNLRQDRKTLMELKKDIVIEIEARHTKP